MSRQVICRAPGKLLIAGEYAVLTPGRPAIVAAIDRYVTVTTTPAWHADIEIVTELTGQPVMLRRDHRGQLPGPPGHPSLSSLPHLLAALTITEELRTHLGAPPLPVRLQVSSALHDHGAKIGLGSSGAVTVAAIHALTTFYGLDVTPETRLRLALMATAQADPRASGADVAASTWGGWIQYTAPDRDHLHHTRTEHGLAAALGAEWPGLSLRPLPSTPVPLHVGWTGRPASTTAKVGRLQDTAWWNSNAHQQFCTRSTRIVSAMADALHRGAQGELRNGINRARTLLALLDQQTSAHVFTPALTALCEAARTVGGAGKPSGAGGGDCGIALLPEDASPAALYQHWEHAGITPLVMGTAPAVTTTLISERAHAGSLPAPARPARSFRSVRTSP
ncbi:phosphomevalonate kinase [Streptomyces sp. NPDC056500]|uniref:phosphomevalonate kinase n=1 Tax=Streptomyces sp. NPDC056500 TaxID=3345840 RepID=UPI0036B5AC2E